MLKFVLLVLCSIACISASTLLVESTNGTTRLQKVKVENEVIWRGMVKVSNASGKFSKRAYFGQILTTKLGAARAFEFHYVIHIEEQDVSDMSGQAFQLRLAATEIENCNVQLTFESKIKTCNTKAERRLCKLKSTSLFVLGNHTVNIIAIQAPNTENLGFFITVSLKGVDEDGGHTDDDDGGDDDDNKHSKSYHKGHPSKKHHKKTASGASGVAIILVIVGASAAGFGVFCATVCFVRRRFMKFSRNDGLNVPFILNQDYPSQPQHQHQQQYQEQVNAPTIVLNVENIQDQQQQQHQQQQQYPATVVSQGLYPHLPGQHHMLHLPHLGQFTQMPLQFTTHQPQMN